MGLSLCLLRHSLLLHSLPGSTTSLKSDWMLTSSFKCSVDQLLNELRTLVNTMLDKSNNALMQHCPTGAWFGLLEFVTKLCVLTNAFLIAITSDFINRAVYNIVYNNNKTHTELCESGSVVVEGCEETLGLAAWSTSPFELSTLLQPVNSNDSEIGLSNFPFYGVQLMHGYNLTTGDKLEV